MPAPQKPRLREILFLILGIVTSAGLMMLWFGAIPRAARERNIDLEAMTGLPGLLVTPEIQIGLLVLVVGLLAAGLATRLTTRHDLRPLVLLMSGCLVAFFALATTVNLLGSTLFDT